MITTRTTLGLRATARALGISHVALLKAERDGRVPLRIDGLFDPEACRTALAMHSHPVKSSAARSQRSEPASETPLAEPADVSHEATSVSEAVRQLEWEKLKALKRKTAREENKLVELAAVNAFVAGMIMKARDDLARIGAELSDSLSQETDPVKCRAHVDDRIFQVLANLKEYRPASN